MAATGPNGANKVALWSSVAVAAVAILTTVGAFFYVAFQGKDNADKIDRLFTVAGKSQDDIKKLELRLAEMERDLNEIETQFCAADQIRNLMHANSMRIEALLYEKTFPGSHLPTDNAYYPTICNRKTK
jgi:hypothetical protein